MNNIDKIDKKDVIYIPAKPLNDPKSGYAGFNPGISTLPKGYKFQEDRLPLPCDMICEQDVAINTRDGITLYADIYRPTGDEKVPAIVSWGSFGKRGAALHFPDRSGMPNYIPNMEESKDGSTRPRTEMFKRCELTGFQAHGGEDPAQWVPHGYAIVNVDPRGVYYSEGDMQYFGLQNGKDAYDVIEWLAEQPWCTGKIGTSGNHWYGIEQWFIAQEQPPHLAAIHPAECHGDFYRDEIVRGGIPRLDWSARNRYGRGRIEDIVGMSVKYPLMNAYWYEKCVKFEKIHVPVYLTASFVQWNHSRGPFDGFNRLSSEKKWLRIHNGFEFIDYRLRENIEDVRKFFDHFLKGIDNDWEDTPRVRLSVLDPGGSDTVNRPEEEFPLKRQQIARYYLDTDNYTLIAEPIVKTAQVSYISDDHKGNAMFTLQFSEETEITGYSKVRLWMSTDKSNDMDIFVRLNKLDSNGNKLFANYTNVYSGPNGRLRASHREITEEKSTPLTPFHPHTRELLIAPFEIVPIEIGIWPTSMKFHAGEQLQVEISGFELKVAHLGFDLLETRNRGSHTIYSGDNYDSFILLPIIPTTT